MFKKDRIKKELPELNTASLPDIIFMLLFFFMVVTVLRKHTVNVEFQLPEAESLEKLHQKSLITYIYMGKQKNKKGEAVQRIQINDAFVNLDEVEKAIHAFKAKVKESDQEKVTVSLKADKSSDMGAITKVKLKLRAAEQYKLLYAVDK
jgi:biopolymer transport protein ExbD